jgi:hypothetical protein
LSEQTITSNQKGGKEGKKKALIIAVSHYDNLPPSKQLHFCKNDGEAICGILKSQGTTFQTIKG